MLEKLILFACFFTLMIFQSCTKSNNLYHYAPIDGNGLKLERKKELKLSGGGSADLIDVNLNAQLAYSPFKNIGIQTGQFYFKSSSHRKFSQLNIKKIAIGSYHHKILKDSTYQVKYFSQRFIPHSLLFELYAGTSFGKLKNRSSTAFSSAEITSSLIHFRKYFIRGSYHQQYKRIGMSFTTKFGLLDYFKGNLDVGPGVTPLPQHYLTIADKDKESFWESSFKFSFGKKNLKIFSGLTMLRLGGETNIFSQEKIYYFGLALNLGGIRKSLNGLREADLTID